MNMKNSIQRRLHYSEGGLKLAKEDLSQYFTKEFSVANQNLGEPYEMFILISMG